MRLTIAYSKIKKRNLVLINNDTYQRETLSERPIRQPLSSFQRMNDHHLETAFYIMNSLFIAKKYKKMRRLK